MTKTRPLLSACLLAACGGTAATSAPPAAGDGHTASGPGTAATGFEDWQTFTRVTGERFLSESHNRMYVEVYADGEASEPYRAEAASYPEGARLVKAQYTTETGGEVKNLTVMRKMAAGYDPEHSDWYYGVFDASGTRAMKQGKIDMCIDCHQDASVTDYVFGAP